MGPIDGTAHDHSAHDHSFASESVAPDASTPSFGDGLDIADLSAMNPAQILDFIMEVIAGEAGGTPAGPAGEPGRFSMANPGGVTPNESAIGLDPSECACAGAGGGTDAGNVAGGGHGAHGAGGTHETHGAGGTHGTHGAGGAHGSPGEPVHASEAPPELVASLGDWVDADGTVRSANPHGAANGHHDHAMGNELNVHAVYEAASAAGIERIDPDFDVDQFIADFVADENNFNPNQSDQQKVVGALTVLNDLTAAVTMGGIGGDLGDVSRIAGSATQAALDGNGPELRNILESAGGDVSSMSDDMLVNVWSTNSHMYNHAILTGDGFELTHLRSLNDKAADGTEPGTLGFYNDTGAWPQWDAQPNGLNFLNEAIGPIPSTGSRTVIDYFGTAGTSGHSGVEDHAAAGHHH